MDKYHECVYICMWKASQRENTNCICIHIYMCVCIYIYIYNIIYIYAYAYAYVSSFAVLCAATRTMMPTWQGPGTSLPGPCQEGIKIANVNVVHFEFNRRSEFPKRTHRINIRQEIQIGSSIS